jgi:beta-glucosidase
MTRSLYFPPGFTWGATTSAYQIEGAWNEAGKGVSIWDDFVRQPGRIERGETGNIAADHYHRYPQDVALMADLGLKAYCFSVAWTRIQPDGAGPVNMAGLDFYQRLVDELLEHQIEPWLMLYHWDLPLAIQTRGGWAARDTAQRFADYAQIVAHRLGDRVSHWVTHNEPYVISFLGHLTGEHAPGVRDPAVSLRVAHHVLLAHGYGVQALRSILPDDAQIGIILDLYPTYPASNSPEDRQAAVTFDLTRNRLFLDPLLRGQYSDDLLRHLTGIFPEVRPGDLEVISQPMDFLGINYYSRALVRHAPQALPFQVDQVFPPGNEYSQMWEVYPEGLYDLLMRLYYDYRDAPWCPTDWYITENGLPVPDGVDFDGRVRDERRIRFLRAHLENLHHAIQDGAPVRGYFHWSLMDNFEWGYGYRMRFGFIYVDWDTQKRIIKDSGRWYSRVIRENKIEASG